MALVILIMTPLLTIGVSKLVLKYNSLHLSGETVSELDDFTKVLAEEMTARTPAFTINYTGDGDAFMADLDNIIKTAYESDDYLHYSWTNISHSALQSYYSVTVDFEVTYLTTREQEDFVDKKAKELASAIIFADMTGEEKVKTLNDYVSQHLVYDYTQQNNNAYSALAYGTANCQGYALLMHKLFAAAGINSKIISGEIPEGPHAWNMVNLGGSWYHVDGTNNDASLDGYKYFLKSDGEMRSNGYTWVSSDFPSAN